MSNVTTFVNHLYGTQGYTGHD